MSGSPNGLQDPWRRDIEELPKRERMSERTLFTGKNTAFFDHGRGSTVEWLRAPALGLILLLHIDMTLGKFLFSLHLTFFILKMEIIRSLLRVVMRIK